MGLLLSVLVACVGVIELFSLYDTIRHRAHYHSTPPIWTVQEENLKQLEDVRNRLILQLNRLQASETESESESDLRERYHRFLNNENVDDKAASFSKPSCSKDYFAAKKKNGQTNISTSRCFVFEESKCLQNIQASKTQELNIQEGKDKASNVTLPYEAVISNDKDKSAPIFVDKHNHKLYEIDGELYYNRSPSPFPNKEIENSKGLFTELLDNNLRVPEVNEANSKSPSPITIQIRSHNQGSYAKITNIPDSTQVTDVLCSSNESHTCNIGEDVERKHLSNKVEQKEIITFYDDKREHVSVQVTDVLCGANEPGTLNIVEDDRRREICNKVEQDSISLYSDKKEPASIKVTDVLCSVNESNTCNIVERDGGKDIPNKMEQEEIISFYNDKEEYASIQETVFLCSSNESQVEIDGRRDLSNKVEQEEIITFYNDKEGTASMHVTDVLCSSSDFLARNMVEDDEDRNVSNKVEQGEIITFYNDPVESHTCDIVKDNGSKHLYNKAEQEKVITLYNYNEEPSIYPEDLDVNEQQGSLSQIVGDIDKTKSHVKKKSFKNKKKKHSQVTESFEDSSHEANKTIDQGPGTSDKSERSKEAALHPIKAIDEGQGSSDKNERSTESTASKHAEPFWLIFSGEYTKAMNKDWHGQHFCCWQCDESLTGQRYVLRDEHPYCVSCYESVFANACEKCSRTIGIDSKDLSYKDKHWHEACFLCTTCGESLVDKQFGSKGDRIYCGRCYDEQFASRCDGCHEIFRAGTKKMEYKTRQWHEKCFCCCVCKVPIGTQSFIPREQEIYCAKCYEDKFATRCIKCNKVITSGGVTYKNEPWHRECFTCTNCQKSLAGERFTSRDEKPYCAECFGELFAKRCFACNRPITGIGGTKFISFEDRHWHNDCFFCANCRTSLVGRGFITDQDDIICPDCAKQKLM